MDSRVLLLEEKFAILDRRFAVLERTVSRQSEPQTEVLSRLNRTETELARVTLEVEGIRPSLGAKLSGIEDQNRQSKVEIEDLRSELSTLKSGLSVIPEFLRIVKEVEEQKCQKTIPEVLRRIALLGFLTRLDRFEGFHEIGESFRCRKMVAKDRKTGEARWIRRYCSNSRFREQWHMFRILEILAGNNHPTALRLIGFWLDESPSEGWTEVTEFHDNGSLESVLKAERTGSGPCLTATQKSKIIFGIVCGMAYLHSRGIFHSNLNPRHILLNEEWEPVIGGFGQALYYSDYDPLRHDYDDGGGWHGPLRSWSAYYGPEWSNDEFSRTLSADVYSFAVTLYAIFGPLDTLDDGKGPIRGLGHHQLRVMWGHRYVRLPEIPDGHWKVICACWQQNPDNRPTFAQVLEYIHSDHKYILPGADRDSVLAYERRVYSNFGPPEESLPLDDGSE
jgi:serine/threonine protein kinase